VKNRVRNTHLGLGVSEVSLKGERVRAGGYNFGIWRGVGITVDVWRIY